jgi:hypothetical protein
MRYSLDGDSAESDVDEGREEDTVATSGLRRGTRRRRTILGGFDGGRIEAGLAA